MKQNEFLQTVSDVVGLKKKEVQSILKTVVEVATKAAATSVGEGVKIPGLGKLVVVDRKARMGRNPATGETIKIPAKKVVKFRLAKAVKEAILAESASKKRVVAKKKTKQHK